MSRREPLSVGILAGGQSRRMGQDKALLRLGGRALLEIVAERVGTVADELFVVASDRPAYEAFGLEVVPDRFPGSGSLGGIYTAVTHAGHPYCLVVACDMPLLNRRLLAYMAELPRTYDVLVPALRAERSDQGGGETLETLHAIYARSASPAMERRLAAGQYKIVGFFHDVRVQRIDEATVRRYDPGLRSFLNTNTAQEFADVSSLMGPTEEG